MREVYIGALELDNLGNKIQSKEQALWIQKQFAQNLYMGSLSYSSLIGQSDRDGRPLIDNLDSELKKEFQTIYNKLGTVPNKRRRQ